MDTNLIYSSNFKCEYTNVNQINEIFNCFNNFKIISYGKYKNKGRTAKQYMNPIIKLQNNDYVMYINNNHSFCYLCIDSYNKILQFEKEHDLDLTFHSNKNYVNAQCEIGLSMHQIIMDFFGQGKGTNNGSIEHIDNTKKYDNRISNLTLLATSKEQNLNSKGVIPGTKRNRKSNAQELPTGIVQEDIPKYVYYCKEKYNKNGDMRDFFRIEKHPNQKKIITTSKSMKITLETKLEEAKEIIKKLDADIYYSEESNESSDLKLPTHFYITNIRNLPHLVYDNRQSKMEEIDGKIKKVVNVKSLKMKLPDNYKLSEQYTKFLEKLHNKYPELIE